MQSKSPYRSSLKNARGLGAAHSGVHHFWVQRVSALALAPLSMWFLVSLLGLLGDTSRGEVALWFLDPINAMVTALLMVALFVHARLGMQTIIEDYVHCEAKKIALLLLNSGSCLVLGLGSIVAIARLHFIGI